MRDPRVAAGVIVPDRQGRILLIQRGPQALTGPGLWAVPGGKLDPGERLAVCAARELLEEVDVTADDLVRLHTLTEDLAWGPDLHFVNHFFFARRWSGTPAILEPDKHVDMRWVSPREIAEAVSGNRRDLPLFEPLIDFTQSGGMAEIEELMREFEENQR